MKVKIVYLYAFFFGAIILFIFSFNVHGQTENSFSGDDKPIKIKITADFTKILYERTGAQDYAPSILEIEFEEGKKAFDINLKSRGNFRRDTANCDFPPLRMKLKNKQVKNTIFEKNNNIKIVTHCKTGVKEFEEFIAKEYLVYKIYNLLTPISFNVRMAEITYVDIGNAIEPITRMAFLIEDIEHVGKRNNMKEYEDSVKYEQLEKANALRLSLFQFMIGNTDWIVQFGKNMKTVSDGENYYAIPYDFDYTALVGTDYTLGGGHSFLMKPERIYKGGCFEADDFLKMFEVYGLKRKEILKTVKKSKLIGYESKDQMNQYLLEFFRIIKSDKNLEPYFLSKCSSS